MKKWFIGALLALMVATPALALAPCGEVVVDEAELLTPAEELRIKSAADALLALGATVRVRTSEGLGEFRSLQHAADSVCASWGGARIVLWVTTVSRDVGIYAGPAWSRVVTNQVADRMIDEHMLPGLQSGSFATAFIQPLATLGELLKPVSMITKTPQAPPTLRDVAPSPVVVTRAPEANQWSFATVLSVVAGIILLIGGWFGLQIFSRERSRKDTLARTQQSAVLQSNQCLEILSGFNGTEKRLKELLVGAKDQLRSDVVLSLEQRFAVMLLAADKANQDFNGHVNPATPDEALGWYEATLASMKASKEQLDGIAEQFQEIEAALLEAMLLVKSMPEKVVGFKTALQDYRSRVSAVATSGFLVSSAETALVTLEAAVVEVEALVGQLRYEEALLKITAVTEEGAKITQMTEALPKLKIKLQKQYEDLLQIFSRAPQELAEAARVFKNIETKFAAVCYESIVGNGTEAEESLDDVEDALNAVKKHLEAQEFSEAEGVLDSVAQLLKAVDGLLDAIVACKEHLDFAEIESTKELAEARRSIDAAEAYLQLYDADTSDVHYEALKEGQVLCEQVAGMLRKAKPNYPEALKLAMRADELADGVLEKAEGEKEVADRERRRAEVLTEKARQELTEVKQYMQNHRGDMSSDTQKAAAEFDVRNLGVARHQSAIVQINQAIALSEIIASVMSRAKRDFNAAEALREAARKRERSAAQTRIAAQRRREDESARQSPYDSLSNGSTRSWGTPRTGDSAGASKAWRSSIASPSSGSSRSMGFASAGRSTGAGKKW